MSQNLRGGGHCTQYTPSSNSPAYHTHMIFKDLLHLFLCLSANPKTKTCTETLTLKLRNIHEGIILACIYISGDWRKRFPISTQSLILVEILGQVISITIENFEIISIVELELQSMYNVAWHISGPDDFKTSFCVPLFNNFIQ